MPLNSSNIRPIHRCGVHHLFLSVGLSRYENSHSRDQRPHRLDLPTCLFHEHVLRLSRTAGGATERPSLGPRPAASVTALQAVGWRGCTRTGPTPLGSDGVGWRGRTVSTVGPPQARRRCAIRGTARARCHPLVGTFQHTRWSRSGGRDLVEGIESGRARPTSERCPPALSSALVDRSINQAGLGMVGREITQQMKVPSDPRTEWIVLQPE